MPGLYKSDVAKAHSPSDVYGFGYRKGEATVAGDGNFDGSGVTRSHVIGIAPPLERQTCRGSEKLRVYADLGVRFKLRS